VTCTPPPPPPSCGLVRENKALELGCGAVAGEEGKGGVVVITEVTYANYGVTRGGCDGGGDGGTLEVGECGDSEATKAFVEKECLGKAACTIAATNQNFGDPCYGEGKTLAVAVRCAGGNDNDKEL
jgi:hypothetical protein